MRLDPHRVDAFVTDPGATRLVLLHGEDIGLARERARRLAMAVAGSSDDPFAVVDIERGSIDAIATELSSLPMTGGRRVVRMRECGDFAVEPIRRALAGDGRGIMIAEAGVLLPRSKLRTFVETSEEGVAISCFPPDAREKIRLLRARLTAYEITFDEEALSWMSARAVDHATAEREAEKLTSFAGSSGNLTLDDVAACSGEVFLGSLDEALFAATAGLIDPCDRALSSAIADGISAIQIIRAGLQHTHRLSEISLAVKRGVTVREAARSARPPVLVRRTASLEASLRLWSEERLGIIAGRLLRAERACKQTGAPADMIARYSIVQISREAEAQFNASRVFRRNH